MLDEKNNHQTEHDPIKEQFGEIKKQVLPPPALEKAVMEGMPYGRRVRTRVHVLRIAKATAAYVVGIALFLGMVLLLPSLWEGKSPVGTSGSDTVTTPEQSPSSPLIQALSGSAFDSVNSIPKADGGDVGKTVELSLENKCFYYFYYPDEVTPSERMITVELVKGKNYGKLVMYSPTLGGIGSLCQKLNEPIQAEIVAVANITREEAIAAFAGTDVEQRLSSAEIVKSYGLTDNPNYLHWYFSIN
jgi:hypothetical protein